MAIDFTAYDKANHTLINAEVKKVLDADAVGDAADIAALNDQIVKLTADLAACRAAQTPTPTPPIVTPPATGLGRGWELAAGYPTPNTWVLQGVKVGLARLGIDRNTLPLYTGPALLPAGTVIERKKITLSEIFAHNGARFKECWIVPQSAGVGGAIIYAYDLNAMNANQGYRQYGPVTLEDCDVDATTVTNSYIYKASAVRGLANILRCDIRGMGAGFAIFGNNVPSMATALIERNVVHGLRGGLTNGDQSHNEAGTVRMLVGTQLMIRDNWLASRTGSDSAALFNQAIAGFIDNLTMEGNLFDTWGWKLALEAKTFSYGSNVRSRNNRYIMDPGGYGPAYVTGGPGYAEWLENYVADKTKVDWKGTVVNKP